jgi:hypothetical protein
MRTMLHAKRHQSTCVWEDISVVLILLRAGRHQHNVTLTCVHVGKHQCKAVIFQMVILL